MEEDQFSYEDYLIDIARYIEDYEKRVMEINSKVQEMIKENKISDNIRIEGRIKSYKSFLRNINNNKSFKDNHFIQDIFGLKIITENESDNRKIADKIKELYEIIRIKNHSLIPTTSYNATHIVVMPEQTNPNSNFIEVQLCTKDQERKNNEGMTAHDIYKIVGKNKSSYEEAKQLAIERHSMLMDLSPEKRKQYLPTYYIVEDNEIKKLDEEETIRKMFPTVFKEKAVAVTNSFKEGLKISNYVQDENDSEEQSKNLEVTRQIRIGQDIVK